MPNARPSSRQWRLRSTLLTICTSLLASTAALVPAASAAPGPDTTYRTEFSAICKNEALPPGTQQVPSEVTVVATITAPSSIAAGDILRFSQSTTAFYRVYWFSGSDGDPFSMPHPTFGVVGTNRASATATASSSWTYDPGNARTSVTIASPAPIDAGTVSPSATTVGLTLGGFSVTRVGAGSPPGTDINYTCANVTLGSTPDPTATAPVKLASIPFAPASPPQDQVIPYSYALAGSASLKTLTTGSLPLSGGIDAKLGLPSGKFTGDLTLAPATGNLTALGFLPVTAQVNLVPTEPVTGTLKNGKLTAVAKVRIKLPSVKTLGIELAGGSSCQAKQISSITLTSTQATFLPLSGGPIAGNFSISDLSGCGFLTGLVSPLTAGSGNTIALNLTPRPVA